MKTFVVNLTQEKDQKAKADAQCLVRAVTNALSEVAIEAVSINSADQTVSVATLGRKAEPQVSEHLLTKLQEAQ